MGPTLFNIFTSDLEGGIKCASATFANDIKLSGEADTMEGRTTLQEDLYRLEKRASKNFVKLNKDKRKVLDNMMQDCSTAWGPPSWGAAL